MPLTAIQYGRENSSGQPPPWHGQGPVTAARWGRFDAGNTTDRASAGAPRCEPRMTASQRRAETSTPARRRRDT